MNQTSLHIPLFDMLMCLSGSIDLVSPSLSNHNRQVAYIASSIAIEDGLSKQEITDIIIAGALHDIGALSLKERLNLLRFEVENVERHAELGYRHIRSFEPFARISPIIRNHHRHYRDMGADALTGDPSLRAANIIYLADRISILMNRAGEILNQVPWIIETISSGNGTLFQARLVDAFVRLASREAFWLAINNRATERHLAAHMGEENIYFDDDTLLNFARLFGRVIDFRSPFTAIHSHRVSLVAEALARHAGMQPAECSHMKIAGLLHDVGKLAVSTEILEKPAALSPDEWNIMKSHPFHTYHLLSGMKGLEHIGQWASRHHERLDGKGYPFHLRGNELSTGDRVLSVADIFTALTENRPYRPGMSVAEAMGILSALAGDGVIDTDITAIARQNAPELDELRIQAEVQVNQDYQEFIRGVDLL
ncbi:MAG: HD domain-containing protein [Spirochaetes bacterium]|nr:HD domain-containing protein [Spirochaetota bacterium]